MATDATGTPTSPDGIPKYNTSVDAPSGLGFNSAMDQLQVALNAKVTKPAGIVSGEVPVWNGSAFARSSVTNIDPLTLASGWQTYTPVWTSSGTQPVLNNGTLTGRWTQIGKTVVAKMFLTAGSTTTFGTANYLLSLPTTAINSGFAYVGGGDAFDSSATGHYPHLALLASTTTVQFFSTYQGPTAGLTQAAPFVWATGDALSVQIVYEAA